MCEQIINIHIASVKKNTLFRPWVTIIKKVDAKKEDFTWCVKLLQNNVKGCYRIGRSPTIVPIYRKTQLRVDVNVYLLNVYINISQQMRERTSVCVCGSAARIAVVRMLGCWVSKMLRMGGGHYAPPPSVHCSLFTFWGFCSKVLTISTHGCILLP